jgi:GcrA cell cycle regulator
MIKRKCASWWTEDRCKELTRLWNLGYTCREIATLMRSPSRNAVIGKARRLNLTPRNSPIRRAA